MGCVHMKNHSYKFMHNEHLSVMGYHMIHSHCIRQGQRKQARNVTETGSKIKKLQIFVEKFLQALLTVCCRRLFQVSLQMTNSPQRSEGSSNHQITATFAAKSLTIHHGLPEIHHWACYLDVLRIRPHIKIQLCWRHQQESSMETCWWRPATPRVATDTLKRIFC